MCFLELLAQGCSSAGVLKEGVRTAVLWTVSQDRSCQGHGSNGELAQHGDGIA